MTMRKGYRHATEAIEDMLVLGLKWMVVVGLGFDWV